MKKNKRISLIILCLFSCFFYIYSQKKLIVRSPNEQIKVSINISNKIYYSVSYQNESLLDNCDMALYLSDEILGLNPKLLGSKNSIINEELKPIIPLKFSSVISNCNVLKMSFKGGYSVEFRVFNNAVAYRFITNLNKKEIKVLNEDFNLRFDSDYFCHIQQPGNFKTAYEEEYSHLYVSKWKENDHMSTLPVLVEAKTPYKILISEADLIDYPAMFLQGTGESAIRSKFPKQPLEFGSDGDRSLKFLKEADYIAKTNAKRTFPWRYFVISKEDKELVENTITMQLSSKCEIEDYTWIKPGQASWEWWNGAAPYGPDVNFVSGYNLDTYKYFIDFAAKYGVEYIIMDEGWAMTTEDPYTPNPKIDLHELIRYGKEKNVGIILWLTWLTVEKNMEIFKTFSEWGIKGVKIDFMDRSDQCMVNYYERVAKEAAKYKILVDFHGSFKPAGLEYRFPNVISYEGVRGMEQMNSCTPNNSIYFPFMRNAVGPMDYTPGAMINMQPEVYCSMRPNSASIGTRAYQMALFVIFESGLQMLADNPTRYYQNAECTEFITQVPTTWDETRVLEAKVGEYIIVAKRKANKWFIGGMTNNQSREVKVNLDFLQNGKNYKAICFEDGINADRQAMDYRKTISGFNDKTSFTIKLARNGGFAGVLQIDE